MNNIRQIFASHLNVLNALFLRDLKTRVGGSYLGLLTSFILPIGHIVILIVIYNYMGRKSPIDSDTTIYLSTAIVPFIVWSYCHQKVMASFAQNSALTSFPVVSFLDIFIARSIVELLSSVIIVAVAYVFLKLMSPDFQITDPNLALVALILSYFLGVSTGIIFGILSIKLKWLGMAGYLLVPIYWGACGVFFIPAALPVIIRDFVWLFPTSQITEIMRRAIYQNYTTDFYNYLYLGILICTHLILGMILLKFSKD